MLSNARALTVLVVAINATLWLYAAGALTTLLFRVVLKLASCADPETCHTPCRRWSFSEPVLARFVYGPDIRHRPVDIVVYHGQRR
jgi:hypothetical protein